MAGSMTDYLENKILEHSLGKTSFSMPAGCYIALFTASPTDAGGGTEVSTASTGYARQQVLAAGWGSATGGSITNAADITFPVATASWNTITAIGIFDAVSGGNMLWWGTLGTSKAIAQNDQFKIAASNLTITLD
jgi:hypothetical protein